MLWVLWVSLGVLVGLPAAYFLLLTVSALLVNPRREYSRNSRYYRFLLNLSTRIALVICHVKVHTSGFDKLPQGERFLLVCNHRSNFDPIITWYAMKDYDLAFLSKGDNFKVPFFGRIIRRCCFMEIDRTSPRKSLVTLNKAAELIKCGEVSVGVYPEGTRSKSCELLPFHNGVFKVAQKAAAKTVVVAISGTERIHRNVPLKRTDVFLDVLEVIPAEEVHGLPTSEIGERAAAKMAEALAKREQH